MSSPQMNPHVMILDADAPPALAFARSLGRAGVPLGIYSAKPFPVTRASRFCTYFDRCPELENTNLFLAWLKREVAKGYVELVAPTSDLLAFYMAQFPECFPPLQQQACCTLAQTTTLLFKDRFDKACQHLQAPTPFTFSPESIAAAHDCASTLPYPLIIKPKSHIGVGQARGIVVQNAEQLRQHFRPYLITPERKMLVDQYPELALPMLQEYVPNALKYLFSISGVLDHQGQVLAASGAQKTQQWPPTLGVGVVFQPWEQPQIMQQGLQLVRQLMCTGIFEIEYIFDSRSQQYVTIDLNPRAHGHIAFDIARGLNLPLYWYNAAHGMPQPVIPSAKTDLQWLHGVPFHIGNWIQCLKGPQRQQHLQRYWQQLKAPSVDISFDATDPLPAIVHTGVMLRHPGGLIRPFWQENSSHTIP